MFLNYLKDTNKDKFLKLCVHAALANGIFKEEQKEIFKAYCRELGVEEHIPETSDNFEELAESIFKDSTEIERKIIVLEILALIKSDGVYDDDEKEFMEKLASYLQVNEDVQLKLEELLRQYLVISADMYSFIFE